MASFTSRRAPVTQSFVDLTASDDDTTVPDISPNKVLQNWGARTHRTSEPTTGPSTATILTGWQPRKQPEPRQRPSLSGTSSSSGASSAHDEVYSRHPATGANPKAVARTSANGLTIVSDDEWRSWPGGPQDSGPLLNVSAWKNHRTHAPPASSRAQDSPINEVSGNEQGTATTGSIRRSDHSPLGSGSRSDRPPVPRQSLSRVTASTGNCHIGRASERPTPPVHPIAPANQGKPEDTTLPSFQLAERPSSATVLPQQDGNGGVDVPSRSHARAKRNHDGSLKESPKTPTAANPGANDAFSTYLPSTWDPSLPTEVQALLEALRKYTHNGKPNRKRVMEWAEVNIPNTRFFIGHGDLSTKSPLSNYTLTQLGMTEEAWKFLNRKGDKHSVLPGPDSAKRMGRPPASDDTRLRGPLQPNNPKVDTRSRRCQSNDSITSIPIQDPEPSTDERPRHHLPAASSTAEPVLPPSTQQISANSPFILGTADARAVELENTLKQVVNGRNMSGEVWLPEEDNLLIYLKETLDLRWQQIWLYFKYRCRHWSGCQGHYAGKLKYRAEQTGEKHKTRPRLSVPTKTKLRRPSSPPPLELDTSMTDHEGPRKSSRLVGAQPRSYRPRDYFKDMFAKAGEDDSEGEGAVQSGSATPQPSCVARRSTFGAPIAGATNFGASHDPAYPRRTHSNMPLSRNLGELERDRAALAGELTWISRGPAKISTGPGGLAASTRPATRPTRLQKRRSIGVDRPYLASFERAWIDSSDFWQADETPRWQGSMLHVGFSNEEAETLEGHVLEASECELQTKMYAHLPPMKRVAIFLVLSCEELRPDAAAIKAQIRRVSLQAIDHGGTLNRTRNSIEAFLLDATAALMGKTKSSADKNVEKSTTFHRLEIVEPKTSIHRSLRQRELGPTALRKAKKSTVREAVHESMGPLLSFTGTSSDVNAVAWSPDGDLFGAGSAAWTDPQNMQYNRPNNLLLGSVDKRSLKELPYHATKRERAAEGSNATNAMHTSQDPLLYQSVSAIGFASDGSAMVSAGYDNCARVFDLRKGMAKMHMQCAFRHNSHIEVLALNSCGLFATGSASATKSIRVFRNDLDAEDPGSSKLATLFSPRAKNNPEQRITPSSLKWGHSIYSQSKYLLCGFSSLNKDFGEGEMCLWDLEASTALINARGSRNIFDVAWSPCTFGRFAIGRTPQPNQVNRGTRSVVHLFDSRLDNNTMQTNAMRTLELECPALDMNDILFNPSDDFLLSVGCTDGATYVWDIRQPDQVMHQFAHGKPLMELAHHQTREESDTGVRFVGWDASGRALCTGSSDGMVARWSPYRAPEDAFERKLAQLKSGIMSGAFNHDFSNLLLGEVNGSVDVLSVGRNDEDDAFEDFTLHEATEAEMSGVYELLQMERPSAADDSGVTTARKLLDSGEMQLRPFGDFPIRQAVPGPTYQGPFDTAADAEEMRLQAGKTQTSFKPSIDPCLLDHDIPRVTEEEKGDDGSSRYRIPENFMCLPLEDKERHIKKHVKCFRCGLDLRLSVYGGSRGDESTYKADLLECQKCKQRWRIDLLGYTPLQDDGCEDRGSSRCGRCGGPIPTHSSPGVSR